MGLRRTVDNKYARRIDLADGKAVARQGDSSCGLAGSAVELLENHRIDGFIDWRSNRVQQYDRK
ncbi:hypothetical protein [Nitrosomonas sp.]|uniref:hypothetical protein n=1 Tax=Nitrosomonas sp. TaxID=42353 RepID=UPI00258CDF7D|nr:hypothetical protein [Nitrosomonas sp.]